MISFTVANVCLLLLWLELRMSLAIAVAVLITSFVEALLNLAAAQRRIELISLDKHSAVHRHGETRTDLATAPKS